VIAMLVMAPVFARHITTEFSKPLAPKISVKKRIGQLA
jgi:hypothetical protein